MAAPKPSSASAQRARFPGVRGRPSPAQRVRSGHNHPGMPRRASSTRARLDQLASSSAFMFQSWVVVIAILVVLTVVLIAALTLN